MTKCKRGRPKGSVGKSAILSSAQIRAVFISARRYGKYCERAELVLSLSIQLGLRANELASLSWADVYNLDGTVRQTMLIKRAYTREPMTIAISVTHRKLRGLLADYHEKHFSLLPHNAQIALFRSQRGGPMTTASMARLLTRIYRQAGISDGSSRSGRRTLQARAQYVQALSRA